MTCNRQRTKSSAKDILWCRSVLKLLNFKKSTVKDQFKDQKIKKNRINRFFRSFVDCAFNFTNKLDCDSLGLLS
jgi:hypothetical protein